MTTLFLLCGLPGSGKTTLARQLEQSRPLLRLSPDDWIARLLRDATDEAELQRLRDPIESLQWDVAARSLALGVSVVLDWGFWSREERADYRARAVKLGAHVELRFLEVARDELWRRLEQRNQALGPETFAVSREQLEAWWALFEPPTAEEIGVDEAAC